MGFHQLSTFTDFLLKSTSWKMSNLSEGAQVRHYCKRWGGETVCNSLLPPIRHTGTRTNTWISLYINPTSVSSYSGWTTETPHTYNNIKQICSIQEKAPSQTFWHVCFITFVTDDKLDTSTLLSRQCQNTKLQNSSINWDAWGTISALALANKWRD